MAEFPVGPQSPIPLATTPAPPRGNRPTLAYTAPMSDIAPPVEPANITPPMTDSEVLAAVTHEIDRSTEEGNSLDQVMVNAWRYFEGTSPGVLDEDVDEFFTSIVSHDVADAVESTLAEILPAWVTERPAEFNPVAAGDEDQAALESDVCNDVLMESGAGYLELVTAAKDALLLRLGVLEVMWEDEDIVEYTDVSNPDPEVVIALMMDGTVEVAELDDGSPTLTIRIKQTSKKKACRVESVPVEEMMISTDSTSLDLDRTRFVGRKTQVSRSSLIAQGYDREVIDSLQAFITNTTPSASTRQRRWRLNDKTSGHPGMDLVQIARCYYRLDEDQDGIAELRYILVAGGPSSWVLLEDEPIDYQPFACGAPYIWPHMPYGISLYDKLKQVQDLKTKYWRIMLESGQRAARDRVGLLPGVNHKDWESSKFGGGIRMMTKDGIVPIPNPTFPSKLGDLQAMADKARREGGGGALDKANREAMPVEAGAHGVERMMTAIEELNAMVARVLAETLVRQVYIKIHHVLRTYSDPIQHKMGSNWANINPRSWIPRRKITVSTGLTMSERLRLATVFGGLAERQISLMEKGSPLVDVNALYRSLTDQLRMTGLRNVDSYYIDPGSEQGKRAAAMMAKQQQQTVAVRKKDQQEQVQMQGKILAYLEKIKVDGRVKSEQVRAHADITTSDSDNQADIRESMMTLRAEQERFIAELGQKYDKLRVDLAKIEAQYGRVPEGVFQNEPNIPETLPSANPPGTQT